MRVDLAQMMLVAELRVRNLSLQARVAELETRLAQPSRVAVVRRRMLAQVWAEGADAMRAAWDTDEEIAEPANPYVSGEHHGR